MRLKDIAEMANISVAAVSRVLNDKPIRISDKKKAEIKKIAKENNYSPNLVAKGLATNKTNTIGLIIPDINNPFFSTLAKILEDELRKSGYLLILVNTDDVYENERTLIRLLLNRGVDGLILAISNESYNQLDQLKKELSDITIPYVLVDRGIDNFPCNQVFFNNRLGGYLATSYLLKMGHRCIGTMMSPKTIINSQFRYEGYLDAMNEYQVIIHDEWSVTTEFRYEDAYEKADKLLNNKEITAIVAGNDMIALGIKQKAKELGLRVPEDISIVGYDNLELIQMLDVPLTTVDQDIHQLGKKTVEVLLTALTAKTANRLIQLNPSLIIKDSVQKINVDSGFH